MTFPEPKSLARHMTLPQLKALLQQGANPNAVNEQGTPPLNFFLRSTYADKKDYLEALLAGKADPNLPGDKGLTALHWLGLIHGGGDWDNDIARLLLKHGADINARDNSGATPLHAATEAWLGSNKPKVMMFLIEEGANLEARNGSGKTALEIAVEGRKSEFQKNSVMELFNTLAKKGRESDRIQQASTLEVQKQLKEKASRAPKIRK